MTDLEIAALAKLNEALTTLEDSGARSRVLRWACEKFGLSQPQAQTLPSGEASVASLDGRGLAGIAHLTSSGDFRFTVRDLKAKNTTDAALRIVHVVVHSYCRLKGEDLVSARKIVVPILRQWRAYSGSIRQAIAAHKGIIREGDFISLDEHAKRDAERFIDEILDPNTKGSWAPSSRRRGKVASAANEESEE